MWWINFCNNRILHLIAALTLTYFALYAMHSGCSRRQFGDKLCQPQRNGHFIAGLLRFHCLLLSEPTLRYRELCYQQFRFFQLVPSVLRRADVHQQLHQSFHLRRQVPWVPERRQTSDEQDEPDSAAVDHCLFTPLSATSRRRWILVV